MRTLSRDLLRIANLEDDTNFAAIIELLLPQAGFAQPVIHCRCCVEAIRYFSSLKPGLGPNFVLLDFLLPRIDGLGILPRLHKGHALRETPIYLLTSSDESEDKRRAAKNRVLVR